MFYPFIAALDIFDKKNNNKEILTIKVNPEFTKNNKYIYEYKYLIMLGMSNTITQKHMKI